VFVIDLDYQLHASLCRIYKGTKPRPKPKAVQLKSAEGGRGANSGLTNGRLAAMEPVDEPIARYSTRSSHARGAAVSHGPDDDSTAHTAYVMPPHEYPVIGVLGQAFGSNGVVQSADGQFLVDGRLLGQSTNIWSIYADPEQSRTWDLYNCKGAKIVISCLVDRDQHALARYMRPSKAPLVCVCDESAMAEELYDAGATYVVQQNYLAARQVQEMMETEMGGSGDLFASRAQDHMCELEEESSDIASSLISSFY